MDRKEGCKSGGVFGWVDVSLIECQMAIDINSDMMRKRGLENSSKIFSIFCERHVRYIVSQASERPP